MWRRLFGDFYDFYTVVVPDVRDTRIIKSVIIWNMRVVKPGTIACLPGQRANHAELSAATAVIH